MTKPNPSHAQPGTRLPTGFRATCRLARWVPIEELLQQNPDTTTSHWDRKLGCEVFQMRCSFATDGRAAFDAHMRDSHDRPLGSYEGWLVSANSGGGGGSGKWSGRYPRDVLPVRMWKSRRPKPLTPADWADRDDVTLTLLDELPEDAVV